MAAAVGLAALVCGLLTIGGPIWAYRESLLKTAAYNKEQEAIGAKKKASDAEVVAQGEKETAIRERNEAKRQARITEVRRLVAESASVRNRFPSRSLLLALEAVRRTPRGEGGALAAAEGELRECLATLGGWPIPGGSIVAISPNGRWLATGARDGIVRLCDLQAADPTDDTYELPGHKDGESGLAFSPDGRWLAIGADSSARLWDLTAADPGAKPLALPGHEMGTGHLAFSDDGKWLVTAGGETGHVWNLTSADPTKNPRALVEHEGAVTCLAISPGGRWLATGEFFNVVRVWDLASSDAELKPRELVLQNGMTTCLAFSPDGRWLATGSIDKTVRVTDLSASDPAAEARTLLGHEGPISCASFSPDGKWLVTGSADKTARVWDLGTPEVRSAARVFRGHEEGIECLAIAPDGRWLATGSDDKTVRIWDLAMPLVPANPGPVRGPIAGPLDIPGLGPGGGGPRDLPALGLPGGPGTDDSKLANELVLRGHEAPIKQLAISPDGHWLVTGSADDTSRLWDLTASSASPRVLRGHQSWVVSTAFVDDGRKILTRGLDNSVRLWESQGSGSRAVRVREGSISCAAASADGRWLALGTERSAILLWDLKAADASEPPRILTGHESIVTCALMASDGHTLITGSQDKTVRLWDLSSADPAAASRTLKGHSDAVLGLSISRDGRRLATGSREGVIRLWDLSSSAPEPISRAPPGLDGQVGHPVLSEDGRWLAAVGPDHSARLWDLAASDPVAEPFVLLGHQQPISCLDFSLDGSRLATGGMDGVARVWDLTNADPAAASRLLRGHEGPIHCLTFTPDGKYLATGSADKTVRLWNLKDTDPERSSTVLRGHRALVTRLVVNADGSQLVSASQDGTARLWDLSLGRLMAMGEAIAGRPLKDTERRQYRITDDRELDSVARGPAPKVGLHDVLAGWPTQARFHEQQAETGLAAGAKFAALFHADRLVQWEPGVARHRAFRARLLLEMSRWREAAADLEVVSRTEHNDPTLLHALALAHLAAGEHDKYAQACALLRDRASGPQWLFPLLDAARLSPHYGVEPARLVAAAEEFARLDQNIGPRFLGAALYRQGQYDKVPPCYEAAARFSPHLGWDYFFLAMTYHRLGKAEEAKAALKAGSEWIERFAPNLANAGPDRVGIELLRREATELISGESN